MTEKAFPLVVGRHVDLGGINSAVFKAGRTQLPRLLTSHCFEVFWVGAGRRLSSFA